MDFDTVVSIISQVGFPIFVAIYVLVRLESTLNQLKDAIDKNTVLLEKVFEYFIQKGGKGDA